MSSNENIVFLVPCYNCGPAIKEVVSGIRPYAYRIVIINDGSTDESSQCIEELDVEKIVWQKNKGKGFALLEGFKYILDDNQWDVVITIDSDGQHYPADVPTFLECYKKTKSEVIIGKRNFSETPVPTHRRLANTFSSKIISSLFGCPLHDIQCGYRLYSRETIKQLLPKISSHTYAIETEMTLLTLKMGFSISEVRIKCIYSEESSKRSAWRPLLDTLHIIKVVIKYKFFFKT